VKAFEHTALIMVDIDRELYTKHGLHLNDRGRELVARKIIPTIKHMLYKKTEEPISITWKQAKVKTSQRKHNNLESEKRETDTRKQDRIKAL
jgi:hypothetical protein